MVIALGYLTGFVPGPLVVVVGALGLMTLGRELLVDRADEALAGASLAIIAATLGIGALRWESLLLPEIRAAQGVIGPTLMVGPTTAAVAAWLGATSATVALSIWLGSSPLRSPAERVVMIAETAVVSFAIVSMFWGPDPGGFSPVAVGAWIVRVGLVTLLALGIARFYERFDEASPRVRLAALALAAVAGGTGLAMITQAV